MSSENEATKSVEPSDHAERLRELVDSAPAEELQLYLSSLAPSELGLAVSRLDEDRQVAVLTRVSPEDAASVVEQIPESQAIDALDRLEPGVAAAILQELPSNEQADLLGELKDAGAEAILDRMDPHEAAGARVLRAYGDDVAGGLMITEVLSYADHLTVGDVVEDMRQNADRYSAYVVQYAYVVDAEKRLIGVLRLRDLLLARRERPIRELAIPGPLTVRDDTSIQDLRAFFDANEYYGVPVVDAESRLLGVVMTSAVEERLSERSEDEYLKSQGLVREELRSMPYLRRSGRRLAWLSVNILLNFAAASVIAAYQDTLSAVITLAVFLPIISDMSGCSGNQAVAVSMRELALGTVRPEELLWVWWKELQVGIINGIALGCMIALAAWIWQGNPYLGAVVGCALMLNTLVAVSIGGLLPLVLKRLGVDPALASGPILTTITDMCGFFLVFSIASMVLVKLIAS